MDLKSVGGPILFGLFGLRYQASNIVLFGLFLSCRFRLLLWQRQVVVFIQFLSNPLKLLFLLIEFEVKLFQLLDLCQLLPAR